MGELKTQRPREGASEKQSSAQGSQQEGILDQARGVASQMADQAKSAVGSRFADRTSKSAAELSEVAEALRHTSRRLEGNLVAPFLEKTADRVERFSGALDGADLRALVHEAESFARREPLVFLGGAFVAGLLGARFLRGIAGGSAGEAQPTREVSVKQTARPRSTASGEGRRLPS